MEESEEAHKIMTKFKSSSLYYVDGIIKEYNVLINQIGNDIILLNRVIYWESIKEIIRKNIKHYEN